MSRRVGFLLLTLALLGGTAAALALPADVAPRGPGIPLSMVGAALPGWTVEAGAPEDALPAAPASPERLRRTYRRGGEPVWVAVEYYPVQAEGRRPPAQKLLLSGDGWGELSLGAARVPLGDAAGGTLPVNLVVSRKGDRQVATMYWYQLGRRSVASDYAYRGLALYDRLARRRADGGLVRVAAPVAEVGGVEAAVGRLTALVQAFHPELIRSLPR